MFWLTKKIDYTSKIMFGASINDSEDLGDSDILRRVAIYEISFADSLKVDSVRTLTGFNPSLDSLLTDKVKRARWGGIRFAGNRMERVHRRAKLLVAFYYYPAEGQHPAFVSKYDL